MKKIIMLIIVLFVCLVYSGHAQDNNTKQRLKVFLKVPGDEWPSQVIFDTIQICYQGTIRWIVMGSPGLLNQVPPYPIARKMTIHCFCVLDKLRTEYKYTPYVDMISKDNPANPRILPNKFMEKAIMCIKEHKTLDGLVELDPNMIDEFLNGNETQIDKKIEDRPPDDNSGKSDSTPEHPKELPEQDVPLLNF